MKQIGLNGCYKFILFFSAFFPVQICALAQNKPITVLRFELKSDNRIYIKCVVNGGDSLLFLFDTGANVMVVNENILGKKLKLILDGRIGNLGANGTSDVSVSSNNKLTFGSINLDNISFSVIQYGEVPFDGVFGSNIMEKYIVEINYDKLQISFYDPHTYIYKTEGYEKFNTEKRLGGVLVIKGAINVDERKYDGYFEIDTSGDGDLQLTSAFVDNNELRKMFTKVATATSTGSDGIAIQAPIVILPEIEIGNKRFYRIPAILSNARTGLFASNEIAGVFGNNFLKRFNVILDISKDQLFLKPNDLLHTPYHDFLI